MTNLKNILRGETQRALQHLSRRDLDGAREALNELQAVISGTQLLGQLERCLDTDQPISRLNKNLFLIYSGQTSLPEQINNAYESIASYLRGVEPLVLVDAANPRNVPACIAEIDGIRLIQMPKENIHEQTLIHEIAHAFLLSGHRVLDEGFAELMAQSAVGTASDAVLARLRKQADGGPSTDRLLAKSWKGDPDFHWREGTANAIFARCALIVNGIIERRGIQDFQNLCAHVRSTEIEDLRPLSAFSDVTVTGHDEPGASNGSLHKLYQRVHRAFLAGDQSNAQELLREVRQNRQVSEVNEQVDAMLLMTMLLSDDFVHEQQASTDLDQLLSSFIQRFPDAAISYALCICREGMRSRMSTDFVAAAESYNRGKQIAEVGLSKHPDSPDILSAAIKFELASPMEYGRNLRACANMLFQAAAVLPYPDLAQQFRHRAREIAQQS
ncbi:MAG: hypothetical protein OXP09_18220 [Gammaproteobacteria bacterium]|nr:hypothetical protein [Gammaproteobacteria bacterium]MDE0367497.1 hypothetical protein [Gammaproteobacteria bacterium]